MAITNFELFMTVGAIIALSGMGLAMVLKLINKISGGNLTLLRVVEKGSLILSLSAVVIMVTTLITVGSFLSGFYLG